MKENTHNAVSLNYSRNRSIFHIHEVVGIASRHEAAIDGKCEMWKKREK